MDRELCRAFQRRRSSPPHDAAVDDVRPSFPEVPANEELMLLGGVQERRQRSLDRYVEVQIQAWSRRHQRLDLGPPSRPVVRQRPRPAHGSIEKLLIVGQADERCVAVLEDLTSQTLGMLGTILTAGLEDAEDGGLRTHTRTFRCQHDATWLLLLEFRRRRTRDSVYF